MKKILTPNIDKEIFSDVIKKSFCEASHRHWHSHRHSHTPTHSHSYSHSHVLYYPVMGGLRPPYEYMIKYMAVAVSGGMAVQVAVLVAGLTKKIFDHPKRFLNQCLGLMWYGRLSLGPAPSFQYICN